jgi:hypothetical protein
MPNVTTLGAGVKVFSVNTQAFQDFILQLNEASAEIGQGYRNFFKNYGKIVTDAADQRLAWSKKIPRTSRTQAFPYKVIIRYGYKTTPIAKWYEVGHTNKSNSWWHPVWPDHHPRDKWKWVVQAKGAYHRPYLRPATEEVAPRFAADLGQQVVNTIVDVVSAFHQTE